MLQGFTVQHDGYSKTQNEAGLKVTRQYLPPCTNRLGKTHPVARSMVTSEDYLHAVACSWPFVMAVCHETAPSLMSHV